MHAPAHRLPERAARSARGAWERSQNRRRRGFLQQEARPCGRSGRRNRRCAGDGLRPEPDRRRSARHRGARLRRRRPGLVLLPGHVRGHVGRERRAVHSGPGPHGQPVGRRGPARRRRVRGRHDLHGLVRRPRLEGGVDPDAGRRRVPGRVRSRRHARRLRHAAARRVRLHAGRLVGAGGQRLVPAGQPGNRLHLLHRRLLDRPGLPGAHSERRLREPDPRPVVRRRRARHARPLLGLPRPPGDGGWPVRRGGLQRRADHGGEGLHPDVPRLGVVREDDPRRRRPERRPLRDRARLHGCAHPRGRHLHVHLHRIRDVPGGQRRGRPGGPARLPDRRPRGRVDLHAGRRLAEGERDAAPALRARDRPARPREPGRLPARGSEARHPGDRRDRAGGVGAARRRRGRGAGREPARGRRPDRGHQRPRHRLLRRHGDRHLYPRRRRRDQLRVRRRRGHLRPAPLRRARLLLPGAQRHRDRRVDHRRRGVHPSRRARGEPGEHARRREPEQGRRRRGVPHRRGGERYLLLRRLDVRDDRRRYLRPRRHGRLVRRR